MQEKAINIKTTVFIEGKYGPSNLGDDILMLTCIDIFSKIVPMEAITIAVQRPEIAKKLNPKINWIPFNGKYNINTEIHVYGGGGQFYSFPYTHFRRDLKYLLSKIPKLIKGKIGLKKTYDYIKFLIHKKDNNLKINSRYKIALGIGIGPFVKNSIEIEIAYNKLKDCNYIIVRDSMSKRWCEIKGLNNCELGTDIAFLWKKINNVSKKENKKIGIIIRNWTHNEKGNSYIFSILKSYNELKKEGWKVSFIFLDKNSDYKLINFLKNKKNVKELIIWDPSSCPPEHFINKELSKFTLIVSSRAHGIIIPSILGIPGICVNIEPKLENVHKMLSGGTLIWGPPFNEKELLQMIKEIHANIDNFSKKISEEVEKNRKKIKDIEEKIIKDMKKILYNH